jgi:hypothetical protein
MVFEQGDIPAPPSAGEKKERENTGRDHPIPSFTIPLESLFPWLGDT